MGEVSTDIEQFVRWSVFNHGMKTNPELTGPRCNWRVDCFHAVRNPRRYHGLRVLSRLSGNRILPEIRVDPE